MDLSKLTQKSQEAIHLAQEEAVRAGQQQVDTLHLLRALESQEGGVVPRLFERLGVDTQDLRARVEEALATQPRVSGSGTEAGKVYITDRLQSVLVGAQDEAKRLKDEYVSVEHLLLALLDGGTGDEASKLLASAGVQAALDRCDR